MKKLLKKFLILLVVVFGMAPRVGLAAGDILAVLFENGSEFNQSEEFVTAPLFCEGQAAPCGEETDFNFSLFEFTRTGGHLIVDIKICQGDSCVTARNALFIGNAIPELDGPEGLVYTTAMTEHDPIVCEDATGIFAEAGCADNLDLNYRCINLFDPVLGTFFKTLAGSFIISTLQ